MGSVFDVVVERLMSSQIGMGTAVKVALTKSATEVHKTAVKKFGNYQGAVGPYNAWAVLNPDYVKRKIAAGSHGDDPLIGHIKSKKESNNNPLRLTITMDIQNWHAKVGTDDKVGEYQEFGTTRIPPRPFLRPALYQNESKIKELFKEAVAASLFK